MKITVQDLLDTTEFRKKRINTLKAYAIGRIPHPYFHSENLMFMVGKQFSKLGVKPEDLPAIMKEIEKQTKYNDLKFSNLVRGFFYDSYWSKVDEKKIKEIKHNLFQLID